MVRVLAVLAVVSLQATLPEPVMPNPNFIVLVDQLDEDRDADWYCVDVAGTDVTSGNKLQAHTCKEPVNDELFETNAPLTSNIYVSNHNVCVAAASVAAGSELVVEKCSASETRQRWSSTPDGQIQASSDSTLCWTVSDEAGGSPAGASGDHLSRTLTLEPCADHDAKYHSWALPGGYVGRAGP